MKKIILSGLFSLMWLLAISQSNKEVKWMFTAKKIANKTHEVYMAATISGDFPMYSQHPGMDGPIPASFTFSKNPLLVLNADVKEVGK
ncbi:MAG: hypothetical protein Q8941_24345 [Bacteroidota bacterium]|nr:hypothetical protein [Bacteroidota bacterium]